MVNDISIPVASHYRPSVRLKASDGFCPMGSHVVPASEVIKQTAFTFEEDRVVIEAQYQNMIDFGDQATWTDIHMDVGANRARRIVAKLIAQ